ncbi:Uncharacterised protein [uncultured archaeon]|nr:Uncharacterised protein [uncultured archaeon]
MPFTPITAPKSPLGINMFTSITYKDYETLVDFILIGCTTITICVPLIARDQSNLSPAFRPNCFTILIGTVVLNDFLLVAANARIVFSP